MVVLHLCLDTDVFFTASSPSSAVHTSYELPLKALKNKDPKLHF